MILGAIIAGGRSRRFGSDKAQALLGGTALLDHVAEALSAQVDALIVVGRDWPGLAAIPDRPAPDLGPLGGLCAALHYARDKGFDAVLTAGCDVLPVPDDLSAVMLNSFQHPSGRSSDGVAAEWTLKQVQGDARAVVIQGQPLFGLWSAELAEGLDQYLASQDDRSMRGWIALSGARSISLDTAFHNLNTSDDLALFSQDQAA